jgi:mannitol/fructose-specific phosphotransferase system IIA component (Ntr-type)
MPPVNFLTSDTIALDLDAASREAVLEAMVGLLGLPAKAATTLRRLLARRELLGSTAVGRGIAIPHCRSLIVSRVLVAYARLTTPLAWDAPDGDPVRHVFLIVAPPVEVSNQYLPTLGQVARLARQPEFRAALDRASTPEDVLAALGS